MNNNYDDIINLPRHVSKKHPQMSIENRAAQFQPFQALTGYAEKVKETQRLTDRKQELTDEEKLIIDSKINYLLQNINKKNIIEVIYFVKDEYKAGGKYVTKVGILKKVDSHLKKLIFNDNEKIDIEEILSIEGDVFSFFEY